MKKQIIITLFLFLGLCELLNAQSYYVVKIDIKYSLDQDRRRWYHNIYYTNSNGIEKTIPAFHMYQDDNGAVNRTISDSILIPASQGPLKKLVVETGRQKKRAGFWFSDCSTGTQRTFFLNTSLSEHTFNLSDNYVKNVLLGGDCYAWGCFDYKARENQVEINTMVMYPDVSINTIYTQLPAEDTVRVKATEGFVSDVYHWQFSVRDTTYSKWIGILGHYTIVTEPIWEDFPNNVQYENNKSNVIFSGEDLMGSKADDLSYGRKNIYIRSRSGSGDTAPHYYHYTNVVSLERMKSAPHIDTVYYEMPKCHGEGNGKLIIKFDRALDCNNLTRERVENYHCESLYIGLNGNRFTETDTIAAGINPTTLEYAIDNLKADTYNISLIGLINYYNPNSTGNTYTDGDRHKYTITIPERPPIKLESITQESVHCKGGADGKINLSASGGAGAFYAYLKRSGENAYIDTIQFKEGATGSFTNIYAGNYIVGIADTNGCTKDVSGNDVFATIEVKEPANAVSISGQVVWQEPSGFGLSDGSAQIYFTGGTPPYAAEWRNSSNAVISSNPIVQEGTRYTSKVVNIKGGKYKVIVKDSNFTSATPTTELNQCGCYDTITFTVSEPQKLEAKTEMLHYITCHGDSDGKIVAHATGGRTLSGSLPYKYEWNKLSGSTATLIGSNDSILNNLSAGRYFVKITDKNNITALSDTFNLTQPDVLTVTIKVTGTIGCSSGSTGAAEAVAKGGTPPYIYEWSSGESGSAITNKPHGNYVVFVRDNRYITEGASGKYCTAQAQITLSAPDGIEPNAQVDNPTCNGASNGAITLNLTGGTPPYTCLWENGSTTPNRSNLPAGVYSVEIKDSKNCSLVETYTLTQPEAIVVNLGNDITLCNGQSVEIGNKNENVVGAIYEWSKNGTIISSQPRITVSEAGTYKLTVTNSAGCFGEDEIVIDQSNGQIDVDFVVATTAANNTKIYAVNITRNSLDSIRWILPDDAIVTEENDDRVQLLFTQNGTYSIGLIGYKGRCSDILYKTINIVDKGNIDEDDSKEVFLKRFIVVPNPNDGNFNAIVELREAADYRLDLYNSAGNIIETKYVQNKISETTAFNQGNLSAGMYFVRFVSSKSTSVFKVIIQ